MSSPERICAPETETKPRIAFGFYRPETILTNKEIESWGVRTNSGSLLTAQIIEAKTGVKRRYVTTSCETTSLMGIEAAKPIVDKVGKDFGAVIFATSYPTGESLSNKVVTFLKLSTFCIQDLYYACCSFVETLAYLEKYKDWFLGQRILIITSEKYSPTLPNLKLGEWDQSLAQTIFSDGALATSFVYGQDLEILKIRNHRFNLEESRALRMPINYDLMDYRPPPEFLFIPPSENKKFTMDGKTVYEAVVKKMPGLIMDAIFAAGLQFSDITSVIPHQASKHMLDGIAKRLPPDLVGKMIYDLEDGNFSSASIPKAWMKATNEGKIKPGDKIVLAAVGAGLFASIAVVEIG